MSAPSEQQRITDQIISRLRQHCEAIAEQDWDYFATCRYHTEAKQAVSDVWRLEQRIHKLEGRQNG